MDFFGIAVGVFMTMFVSFVFLFVFFAVFVMFDFDFTRYFVELGCWISWTEETHF